MRTNRILVFAILLEIGLAPTSTPTFSQNSKKDPSGQEQAFELKGDLVEVPVIVRTQDNRLIADLKKEDFILSEEGVEQPISFFAHTEEPFHVALLIDTSGSTEEELPQIQTAAMAFVNQLHSPDRVTVVSFATAVRFECDFTSDRTALTQAIRQTRAGGGTVLYEAVQQSAERLRPIKGRKAMVLFTDGVDTASIQADYNETLTQMEESNVLVYTIRYDTIDAVRRGLRQPKAKERTVRIPAPPPTPPDRTPPQQPPNWPYPEPGRSPSPSPYPRRSPLPSPSPWPGPTEPTGPVPGDPTRMPRQTPPDDETLEAMYEQGATYLWELANRTGGVRHEARVLGDLQAVFQKIAEELRHQYTLGYYRANTTRDGRYRRIRVKVNRSEARVRARPGYWATER
jgi:VWFA-related protein